MEFDWWSKYYYSVDDERRTQPEYVDEGYDKMMVHSPLYTSHLSYCLWVSLSVQVYDNDLEEYFNKFEDLAQTFLLYRGKGSRDPEEREGYYVKARFIFPARIGAAR